MNFFVALLEKARFLKEIWKWDKTCNRDKLLRKYYLE